MKSGTHWIAVTALALALFLAVALNTSVGGLFGGNTAGNGSPSGSASNGSSTMGATGVSAAAGSTLPDGNDIYINEVVTANHGTLLDNDYGAPDWIELYNPTGRDINIGNYALSDDENDPAKFLFPDMIISAHQYLLVYAANKLDSATCKNPATGFKLASRGLTLFLMSSQGASLQKLSIPALAADVSYAYDGHSAFGLNNRPTPGQANSSIQAKKDAMTAMPGSSPLRITEVLMENTLSIADSRGEREPWVEVSNVSGEPVQLGNYALSDVSDKYNKWTFPQLLLIPGESELVFCSGQGTEAAKGGELHTDFKLDPADEGIYLTNLVDMEQQSVGIPKGSKENVSYGLQDGKWRFFPRPTPGTPNTGKGYASMADLKVLDLTGIWINEVCAVQAYGSAGEDWIEIANGGAAGISLKGYYLSDDIDNLKKYSIGGVSIPAGGSSVISATADSARQKDGVLPFGLSGSGETLILSSPQGVIVDTFDTGVLRAGYTSGRAKNDASGERVLFDRPTPGAANAPPAGRAFTRQPVFSLPGGFQVGPVRLSITCPDTGARIYYTLDGSAPTPRSSLYSAPISITKNTPVRAIACAPARLPSEATAATYLFGQRRTVPVFCITGDEAALKKILQNSRLGRKPEIPAYIEYYDSDGRLGVSFASGLRAKGRASLSNPQKSLVIRLRSDYGTGSVTYPFFPGSGIDTFSALALRNAGQDNRASRIHDSYFARVFRGMNVDSIETRTVVAYINGKYYGLFDLDEEQNADYLAQHYGLDPHAIDMIERNNTVMDGDVKEFLRVRQAARKWNMKDDAVFAEFSKLVDVDACMDYLIAQIYFGNGDVINQRFWRARDYSVKWRPILYDLDWCMRFNTAGRNVFRRYFNPGGSIAGNGAVTYMDIFCALRRNKGWCDRFVERFVQLSVTQFSTGRILGIFDQMVAGMEPEMPLHIGRFHTPRSMAAWKNELGKLRRALEKRQNIVLAQLQRYFSVSKTRLKVYMDKYAKQ